MRARNHVLEGVKNGRIYSPPWGCQDSDVAFCQITSDICYCCYYYILYIDSPVRHSTAGVCMDIDLNDFNDFFDFLNLISRHLATILVLQVGQSFMFVCVRTKTF